MPKPWHKVVAPREDLREGRPLDASEFAVHLDQIRDGRAIEDYQNPVRFFQRTFLTKGLCQMAGDVMRRLAGERTQASAVYAMATEFGAGKTHALALLYHLASHGPEAASWSGVQTILEMAGLQELSAAATAVFVGNEFDSIKGRGGEDGTPHRKTPWGEIAYQLAGEDGLTAVAEHDKKLVAPAGEVIRRFIPQDRPSLILIDELMNYVSRNRKSGLAAQLYNFIQNLTEAARGSDGVVVLVSVPSAELEMTADDRSDYGRFRKLLDRVGKAVDVSADSEVPEIVRRRVFEWVSAPIGADGRIRLTKDAIATCRAHADWCEANRSQLPGWFAVDHAKDAFQSAYPLHPMVFSVFERKWQRLPRFQKTRGILRLVALWVSDAYQKAAKGEQQEPLIGMGSAPIGNSPFRSALIEQLGQSELDGVLTTDICGGQDAHAVRLDREAVDTIRKAQLHRKAATAIFFESSGGQTNEEATLPEIRLSVAGPGTDPANVETALEGLARACYHLEQKSYGYRFTTKENLNKRFADRRASIKDADIDAAVQEEIRRAFPADAGVARVFFPQKSGQVPDRPRVSLVIVEPEKSVHEFPGITKVVEQMTGEHGRSARTYKSGLLWIVPESAAPMREASRRLIAWQAIRNEGLDLDAYQRKQIDEDIETASRDLTESVWRAYRNVMYLGPDNQIETLDLGLVTSGAAQSLTRFVLLVLKQKDITTPSVLPDYLVRHWPPALREWSTKRVRDAFFASPLFPRLLSPETLKETVAQAVSKGQLAYVGKAPNGGYDPFLYETAIAERDVDMSDDRFIITSAEAARYKQPPRLEKLLVTPERRQFRPGTKHMFTLKATDQFGRDYRPGNVRWEAAGGEIGPDGAFTAGAEQGSFVVSANTEGLIATAEITITEEKRSEPSSPTGRSRLKWSGEVAHQTWTNLYRKVLARLVSAGDVKIRVSIEADLEQAGAAQQIEEMKAALRGLNLDDDIDTEQS